MENSSVPAVGGIPERNCRAVRKAAAGESKAVMESWRWCYAPAAGGTPVAPTGESWVVSNGICTRALTHFAGTRPTPNWFPARTGWSPTKSISSSFSLCTSAPFSSVKPVMILRVATSITSPVDG